MSGGLDHEVSDTDRGTVLRRRLHGDAALTTEQEAALLEVLGAVLPVSIPRVRRTWPPEQMIEMDRVPGEPLLNTVATLGAEQTTRLAEQLATLLEGLRRIPAHRVESLVPVEASPLHDYHDDAVRIFNHLWRELPADVVDPVRAFLSEPLPSPSPVQWLCHNDLGAEHIFVDPSTYAITGIIDWSDASIADPCLDLGLVWRDLGEAAFQTAARHMLPPQPDGDDSVRSRARFYARVRALEDLEFGVESGRRPYVANAVRALHAVF